MNTKEEPIPDDLMTYEAAAQAAGVPYGTVKSWAVTGQLQRWYQTAEADRRGACTVRPHVSLRQVRQRAGLLPVEPAQVQLLPDPAPAAVLSMPDPALRTLALVRVADLTGALTILRRQCPDAVTPDMVAHLADDLAWLQGKL